MFKIPTEPFTNEEIEDLIELYVEAYKVLETGCKSVTNLYILTVGIEFMETEYPWLKLVGR